MILSTKRLTGFLKRTTALSLAALFLASSAVAIIPLFAGRAEALTPSNATLTQRQSGLDRIEKVLDLPRATCYGYFTTEPYSPQFLLDQIFVYDSNLAAAANAATPADMHPQTGNPDLDTFTSKIGDLTYTQAWKLTHVGANIPVIKFKPQTDGNKTPVNGAWAGANPAVCNSQTLVQITNTRYAGWQFGANEMPQWFPFTFDINPANQSDSTGRTGTFRFTDPTGVDCPEDNSNEQASGLRCEYTNFVIEGVPGTTNPGGGGGGPSNLPAVNADWIDAAHIKLSNGEIYRKTDWDAVKTVDPNSPSRMVEEYSLYFLDVATGERSKITRASGKDCNDAVNKANNPISQGDPRSSPCTAKNSNRNCVPFIAVHQAINMGRGDDDDISTTRVVGNGDEYFSTRMSKLGTASAQFYDYKVDEACTYLGSAPVTTHFPDRAQNWFYYSAQEDKFATVFSGGRGNEIPYVGSYTPFGTNVYQGGANGCAGQVEGFDGFKTLSLFHVTWKFTDGRCASGTPPYATLSGVGVIGGADGEAGFAAIKGSLTQNTTPTHGDEDTVSCETAGAGLGWLLCPISNGLAAAADWILNTFVIPLLKPNPIGLDPSDSVGGTTFQIWSVFRIYGNIVLVVALLVAVLSQAFGGGVFEAYAARKMLPRILVSAILINVSIYLVALAVDISRIVGSGIGDLITSPLSATGNFTFTIDSTSGNIIGGVLIAIIGAVVLSGALSGGVTTLITSALPFLFLFIGLPAILIIVGIFITVVMLQAIITALIIFAPVAFALYCLPNTQKYFQTWWDWLFRSLLVYPIISVVIALANVMTALIQQANPDGASSVGAIVIAFFVQFLPLILIPFSFKLAGGLIGKLNQLLGGYGGKLGEFIKGNPNDPNSFQNRAKRRFGGALSIGQANVLARANAPGASRFKRFRARIAGSGLFGDVQARYSAWNAEATKIREAKTATGNDEEIRAAAGYIVEAGEADHNGKIENRRRYFNGMGKEISSTLYARGQRLHGGSHSEYGAAFAYALGKAQTDEHKSALRYGFAKRALSEGWTQSEIGDYWAMATYGHKGINASQWYSTPKLVKGTGGARDRIKFEDVGEYQEVTRKDAAGNDYRVMAPVSYGGMIDDLHKSRQSFQVGADRDEDFRVMAHWQEELEQKALAGTITQEELELLGKTYETFDAVSQRIAGRQFDDTGEPMVSAAGATPAAQAVIQAAVGSRRLVMSDYDIASGQRTISEKPTPPPPGSPAGTPATPGAAVGSVNLTGATDRKGTVQGGDGVMPGVKTTGVPREVEGKRRYFRR